jgi:squalene-hopene/tetraprenyl-beta-curcumene cyclase
MALKFSRMEQTRLVMFGFVVSACVCTTASVFAAERNARVRPVHAFDSRAAAAYLDARMAWWSTWPTASRDHGTSCVSCHTALPYALARPALSATLNEADTPAPERRLIDDVIKRVRLWRDVEPFYPDQTVGLPKTSESRGTEAVLNALILSRVDVKSGTLSEDARQAFANLWALQFRTGEQKGAWAWLNFRLEPWESTSSAYFGAALAAIAVGGAPGGYASDSSVRDRVDALRAYLQRSADTTHLLNRFMALWASGELPDAITTAQRGAVVDAAFATQRADGGWSTGALGPWKRRDASPADSSSDGYATGLALVALEHGGIPRNDDRMRRGLAWLEQHQDPAGMWRASSVNKARDPASDAGKFMTDAATAYAAMALAPARAR